MGAFLNVWGRIAFGLNCHTQNSRTMPRLWLHYTSLVTNAKVISILTFNMRFLSLMSSFKYFLFIRLYIHFPFFFLFKFAPSGLHFSIRFCSFNIKNLHHSDCRLLKISFPPPEGMIS